MIRQNWQMFPKAISETMTNEIVSIADKTTEASTFNNGGDEIRKSKVSWIKDVRILNLLHDFVDIANKNTFKVNIHKQAQMQFTEYLASEGGHYNWHHDIDWNRNDGFDRKLSVTVQLSNYDEYEGGDFTFSECESPNKEAKEKGTVLIFPSYLQHKVSPITKGTRRSLVAWFEGPKWQ